LAPVHDGNQISVVIGTHHASPPVAQDGRGARSAQRAPTTTLDLRRRQLIAAPGVVVSLLLLGAKSDAA
jgi:hypothetical protein